MRGSPLTTRRVLFAASAALIVGLGLTSLVVGFSDSWLLRLIQGLLVFSAGVVIVGGVAAFVMLRLAGWQDPESEEEFEALVLRAEELAAADSWADSQEYAGSADAGLWAGGEFDEDADPWFDPENDEDFKAIVRSALDELPLEFHRALEHVAVVVSDGGRKQRAYGLYQGDTVARDFFHDRIVIFRDTLVRDFGDDPELLKAQVTRTVRHELAHHLGWGERGVRGLGL